MKKEMTLSFAVTLGTLATATACHAEEAIAQPLPENSATTPIAPHRSPLSTVETAKPTLDRTTLNRTADRMSDRMIDSVSNRTTDRMSNQALATAPTPEFSPPKDEAFPNIPTPKSPTLNSPILNSSIQTTSAAKPTLIQIKSPELAQKFDLAQTP